MAPSGGRTTNPLTCGPSAFGRGLIVIDGTYRFGQTSSGSSALGLSSLDIDLKKTYRPHYTAGDEVDIVDVPVRPYLMIDGCLPFVVFSQGALPPDFLA